MKRSAFLLSSALSLASILPAQVLVRDINRTGAQPRDQIGEMGRMSGGVLFSGSASDAFGKELWFTDGTTAGTRFVRDLAQGGLITDPHGFRGVGSRCFFFAGSETPGGRALWVTDGTARGTRLVRRFVGIPSNLQILDTNRVLFVAQTAETGRELWVSNGDPSGTSVLRDIRPGSASSLESTVELTRFQNTFYFAANDGVRGNELWTTDGTTIGTRRLLDIEPGARSSSPRNIVPTGFGVFFTAYRPATGREIWHWDKRTARMVGEIVAGSRDGAPRDLTLGGFDTIYFTAQSASHGRELWSASKSRMSVTDVNPGTASSSPSDLTMVGLSPYFVAYRPDVGRELFRVTNRGLQLVADAAPGAASSRPLGVTWLGFGKPLVFSALVSGQRRLYVENATGATRIHDRGMVSAGKMAQLGSELVYAAQDGIREELWATDGTAAGTRRVKTLNPSNGSSNPKDFFYHRVLDRFFFTADDETHGRELWTSDGTATGTRRLSDIRRGSGDSNPRALTAFGNHLVFTAEDGTRRSLYSSDGSRTGTRLLVSDVAGFAMTTLTGSRERLLIHAHGPHRLLAWDGSRMTTLTELDVGLSFDIRLTNAGSSAYFFTSTSRPVEITLWTTDGTVPGTRQLRTWEMNEFPSWTQMVGTRLYFPMNDGTNGNEPWTSLGSTASTRLLANIAPGAASSHPRKGVAFRGMFVFSATEHVHGRELWKSDGTRTQLLRNIAFLGQSSDPHSFVATANYVYFSAWSGTRGRELWRTAGTGSSTTIVTDIEPRRPFNQAISSNVAGCARADSADRIVFAAGKMESGYELWTSDSTAAGTRLVADLRPGAAGSYPSEFLLAGDTIYVSAFQDGVGRELYKLPASAIGGAVASPFGRGSLGALGRPTVQAANAPRVGNPKFVIQLSRAAVNTVAVAWIAPGTRPVPVGKDCTLHALESVASLTVATNRRGDAAAVLPIPKSKDLVGVRLFTQFGIVDKRGCVGGVLSVSDAMRIVIGL